jgi:hypothetical protein
MHNIAKFSNEIFATSANTFTNKAINLFRWQAENNLVYKKFLQYLNISHADVADINDIPFLPVELFKSHKIISGDTHSDFYFESSGTTSESRSRHYIADLQLYDSAIIKCFGLFYGDVQQYCFLALLPSYLERKNASLVYMCNRLMQASGNKQSGFFLNDFKTLSNTLIQNERKEKKTILIGVSFALRDFAGQFPMQLRNTIVIETGGMKGRRTELVRKALHEILKSAFGVNTIHSEYGMAELLSQAYAKNNGRFYAPPWMKIIIREAEDPLTILQAGRTGCINIIDLANIYSCSFIATQDLGKLNDDDSFEVMGRYDNSDIRGCNLMVE